MDEDTVAKNDIRHKHIQEDALGSHERWCFSPLSLEILST